MHNSRNAKHTPNLIFMILHTLIALCDLCAACMSAPPGHLLLFFLPKNICNYPKDHFIAILTCVSRLPIWYLGISNHNKVDLPLVHVLFCKFTNDDHDDLPFCEYCLMELGSHPLKNQNIFVYNSVNFDYIDYSH